MTEPQNLPRFTLPEYERAAWTMFEATVRGLIHDEGLTMKGLLGIRSTLIHGFWSSKPGQLQLPPDVAARKTLLLSDVATAAAAAWGVPEWPFPNDLVHLDVPDHLDGGD